jgi:hypothetical protein
MPHKPSGKGREAGKRIREPVLVEHFQSLQWLLGNASSKCLLL